MRTWSYKIYTSVHHRRLTGTVRRIVFKLIGLSFLPRERVVRMSIPPVQNRVDEITIGRESGRIHNGLMTLRRLRSIRANRCKFVRRDRFRNIERTKAIFHCDNHPLSGARQWMVRVIVSPCLGTVKLFELKQKIWSGQF